MKNKIFLITGLLLVSIFYSKAQNSPIFIWGGGLDGTTYQKTGLYSELYGLLIEAPLDASGTKLPIQFGWRGGGGYALKILSNGNIGIGTEAATEKLSVNGNIRAREIKVENNNWPDFVFARDYQLPTLLETEKHIKDKGHLPGIPSAAEVKANGVDLGEMNAKLLQKIEELTLHLIEMKKENAKQQEEIDKLKITKK